MTSGVEQKYTPTLEQQGAIQMSTENKSFKLSAFAGSGKTSTLKLINEAKNNQKGIYLAFNKVIAIEAQKKFNQNVKCKTFHSLAYEGVPRFITDKLNNPRIMPSTLQSQLGLRNTNLAKAKELGIERFLVTCNVNNKASEKTILANGGVFEKIVDAYGNEVKRYWIDII